MKVLVAGGTGVVGHEIARAMARAGHRVSVLSRSQPPAGLFDIEVGWAGGDVTDPATLAEPLRGIEAVVDAVQFPNSPIENPRKGYTFERVDLGGTKNLVDAAKTAGVQQFIDISGAGAAEDAPYHWQRFKWQEEQYVAASGVPYTIFRQSWVYGPRDHALNRFLGFARRLPFVPVIGDGRARINPLFVRDIGEHAVAALENPAARNRLFEIGGPEVLTMNEIIRTALGVAGKRRFLLHAPKWWMRLVARVLRGLPGRALTPDALEFVTMDAVTDTRELQATFGLRLTPLAEGLATYLGK